jgi:hypothetical protein
MAHGPRPHDTPSPPACNSHLATRLTVLPAHSALITKLKQHPTFVHAESSSRRSPFFPIGWRPSLHAKVVAGRRRVSVAMGIYRSITIEGNTKPYRTANRRAGGAGLVASRLRLVTKSPT